MKRSKARELMMQMIFEMNMQKDYSQELKERFFLLNEIQEENQAYFNQVFEQIKEHILSIDELINEVGKGWSTETMPAVDLAILRLAIAEMIYLKDIPVSVAINEAVELAKRYSTEQSSKFVNGMLGTIARGNHA